MERCFLARHHSKQGTIPETNFCFARLIPDSNFMKTPFAIAIGLFVGASGTYLVTTNPLASRLATESGPLPVASQPIDAAQTALGPKSATTTSLPQSGEERGRPQVLPKTVVPSSDRLGALGVLGQARNHGELVQALESLLPAMRGGDPLEFAKSALDLPDGVEKDMALMLSLGNLASRDPSAALTLAESLPAGEEREMALRWVATGLPPRNISQALALAEGLSDPDTRKEAIAEIIAARAASDPADALSALANIQDARTRNSALAATAQAWAASDPVGALNFAVEKATLDISTNLLSELASSPRVDSGALLDAVLSNMPSGDSFHSTVCDLFENWAAKDPSAAAQALMKIPPGPSQASAAADIAAAMAKSGASKQQVAAWVASLPEGNTRKQALDSLYDAWGNTDPEGAIGEVARLQGVERQSAMVGLIDSWSAQNPARILDWAVGGANGFSEAREPATQYGIRSMARHDPEAAAKRVEKMPPALRASANSALIEVWSEVDAEAAADWLSKQPRGPQIDGAADRLARSLVREDPEMALEWALAISSPDERTRTARDVANQWKDYDPVSAREFAGQTSDLKYLFGE